MEQRIAEQLTASARAIAALSVEGVAELARRLDLAQREGRLIAICGNGGSAATAQHMAADLNKNTGRRFRCVCLSDNAAWLTALSNDMHYECGFYPQVGHLLDRGDVLIGISASGNSPNVLEALRRAKWQGSATIGLLGGNGGKALEHCDAAVMVPSNDYGVIEDAHLAIVHALVVALRGEA